MLSQLEMAERRIYFCTLADEISLKVVGDMERAMTRNREFWGSRSLDTRNKKRVYKGGERLKRIETLFTW